MTKETQDPDAQPRKINWLIVGGMLVVGVVLLGVLYLTLGDAPSNTVLSDFCAQNPGNCAIQGAPSAAVSILEVADFGCPHCAQVHNNFVGQLVSDYVDTGQAKWIAVPFSFTEESAPAAKAAMCASEQTEYLEYASAVFGIEDRDLRLSSEGIRQAAEQLNLDLDAFATCVDTGRYDQVLIDNRNVALQVIDQTPTFFINGQSLVGPESLSDFQKVISSKIQNP